MRDKALQSDALVSLDTADLKKPSFRGHGFTGKDTSYVHVVVSQ